MGSTRSERAPRKRFPGAIFLGKQALACYDFSAFSAAELMRGPARGPDHKMPNSPANLPPGRPAADPALVREIATLMISSLNLDVTEAEIDPAAPLYGEGLGLDSIDILEVALVVSKKYGFVLKEDDQDNARIFRSLDALAAHVAERRTK
jgi:acyl carrier protein